MTLLCAAITAPTVESMITDTDRAFAAGADVVELRLDCLDDPHPDVCALLPRIDGRSIATCRPTDEGGHYAADTSARIGLLEAAGLANADYLDCEFATWSHLIEIRERIGLVTEVDGDSPHPRRRLILSHHDFSSTPEHLDTIFDSLLKTPAHVIKIATRAETIVDSLRMLSALHETASQRPTIALCMGEAGLMTRVLAKKLGGFLTFVSLERGRESAPGQPTLDELKRLYRWDVLDADTAVYGVIGCPVAHSMSPAIHNAAFGAVDCNAVYLPFLVESGFEAFGAFVQGCIDRPWLTLRGLSVTIPHKLSALRFVGDHVEPLAARIGAVNTLVIDESGSVRGLNTDYAAILDALTDAWSCARSDLRDVPVAVLGAGGAARAAVAGLTDCGARVTIFNRTGEKARTLAGDFDADARDWADRGNHDAKVVINATSLGMHPDVDDTPLSSDALREGLTVFDTVYNPIETRLLTEARQIGCTTIDGVTMFVRQAAAQFNLFTGHDAPVDLMRSVVVKRLSA